MKNSIHYRLACLLLLCFGSTVAHAGCPKCPKPPKFIECEKTYIQPSQIDINQKKIMINCNDRVYETSTLYTDDGGLYFKDYRDQGKCRDGFWECNVCHDCNENYYLWCRVCYN